MGEQKCLYTYWEQNKTKTKLEMCKCVWIEIPSNLLIDVREEKRSAVKMRGEAVMWIGDNEMG